MVKAINSGIDFLTSKLIKKTGKLQQKVSLPESKSFLLETKSSREIGQKLNSYGPCDGCAGAA